MFESWFIFESKEKKKRREERYFKKVYPFGKEQQEWEETRLKVLFPVKKDIKMYIYHILVLKERLANTLLDKDDDAYEELPEEKIISSWRDETIAKGVGAEALNKLERLALMQFKAKALKEREESEE